MVDSLSLSLFTTTNIDFTTVLDSVLLLAIIIVTIIIYLYSTTRTNITVTIMVNSLLLSLFTSTLFSSVFKIEMRIIDEVFEGSGVSKLNIFIEPTPRS